MNDKWIEELQQGRQEPLAQLMKEYNGLVYRVLSRFCNDSADLEELIQEVWIKVFFKIKELKKKASFRAWLVHIAYFLGIDYLRKKNNKKNKRAEIEEFFFEQTEKVFDQEIHKIVWEEVRKLKMKYQLPIIMYFFEQFSYEEIAEVSNIKLNTIKSLIKRGKEILAENLNKRGVNLWNI